MVKDDARVSTRKVKPASTAIDLVAAISISGKQRVRAPVIFDFSGQHTVTWHERVTLPVFVNGKKAELPPGSCNLYKYPKVYFTHLRKGKGITPPVEQLLVLEELVRSLVLEEDEEASVAFLRDNVGATPLLGLLVANTKPSLALALGVYRQRPVLLQQSHTLKVFLGENALHILTVNRREEELCECIQIAASQLKAKQLEAIFWTQASGVFFADEPMAYYGGTPVSYAVAFSLQEALRTMLRCSKQHAAMAGVIDFNDPAKSACQMTGLLPVHVAVANSLTNMFNFLIDLPKLPVEFDDMRATPDKLSEYGSRPALSLMLPMQIAAKLGDKKMVQYILRTQSKQQWVWGPVSEYNLDLKGIDSVGDTGNDVMEICAGLDALEETQGMLLDDFMAGLLNDLFVQKFYGRSPQLIHYLMRVIDLVCIVCEYLLALWLRENPGQVLDPPDGHFLNLLPYVILLSIVPLLFEDVRVSLVWWSIARSGPQDAESKQLMQRGGMRGRAVLWSRDLHMLLRWMWSHNMWVKFAGWAMAASSAIHLLDIRSWPQDDSRWDASFITARDRTDALLIPLSLASFLQIQAFFSALLFQFESLGVFYRMVFMMLFSDVANWVVLFVIFLMNYGMVLYITYPRFQPDFSNNLTSVPAQMLTNDYSEPAPDFLSIMSATQSLVELAFIGEPLDFDLEQGLTQDDGTARGTQKLALFCLFYAFYLFYIIMSLVLLLNLLIAMMGDTYSGARENATRQFRVNFARRVLRLELQLLVFNRCGLVTLHCGKRVVEGDQETWVFTYRNYEANAEGGGRRGSKPSMFDHEVEKFAEDDERDDDGPGAVDDQVMAEQLAAMKTAPGCLQRQSTNGTLKPFVPDGAGEMSASRRDSQIRKIGKVAVVVTSLSNGHLANGIDEVDHADEDGTTVEVLDVE